MLRLLPQRLLQWWLSISMPSITFSWFPIEDIWALGIAYERIPGRALVAILILRWEFQAEVSR